MLSTEKLRIAIFNKIVKKTDKQNILKLQKIKQADNIDAKRQINLFIHSLIINTKFYNIVDYDKLFKAVYSHYAIACIDI